MLSDAALRSLRGACAGWCRRPAVCPATALSATPFHSIAVALAAAAAAQSNASQPVIPPTPAVAFTIHARNDPVASAPNDPVASALNVVATLTIVPSTTATAFSFATAAAAAGDDSTTA